MAFFPPRMPSAFASGIPLSHSWIMTYWNTQGLDLSPDSEMVHPVRGVFANRCAGRRGEHLASLSSDEKGLGSVPP